jgi:uncharacterized SAM-binding protein YcdF (DUF218 family)
MRDFVVIFGALLRPDGSPSETLRRRVAGAAQAGAGLRSPIYVVTGAMARGGRTEAAVMRELLLGHGVAEASIVVEDASDDTLASALNVRRILARRGDVGRVFVASSAYHIPRCQLLLRLLGISAGAVAMDSDLPWLGLPRWTYYLLREAVATPFDAALMLTARRRHPAG